MPFVADKPEESAGGFVPDEQAGGFVPDAPKPEPTFNDLASEAARTGRLPSRDILAKLSLVDRLKLMGSVYFEAAGNSGAKLYEEQTKPQITLPSAPDLSSQSIQQTPITFGGAPIGPTTTLPGAAYNAVVKPAIEGLSSPVGLGTLPLAAVGRIVPAAKAAATGIGTLFTGLMAHDTIEQIGNAKQVLADPGATTQQKQEAVLSPVGTAAMTGLGALGVIHEVRPILADRIAFKTPEQKVKAIREEIGTVENKGIADALTDAADSIDRDIAAAKEVEAQQKLAQKAASDQQRAIEQQQKAQIDAQKQAADAQAAAAEVPKSTQILQESQTPPPLANIATEIGTQTSPYAVQEKLNALTAPPPSALDQIKGPEQLPAADLSPEALAGRQRAAAMRRSRDAGPLLDEIVEPVAPELEKVSDAKANFERRKAIFDAQKRADKEAAAAQKVIEDEAADEAKWMAEQKKLASEKRPAPAEFVGIQEGLPAYGDRPAVPDTELFNLTEDIPGHTTGSTLSRQTLEKYGYEVPKRPSESISPVNDFDKAWKKGGEISGSENQIVIQDGRVFKRAYNADSKEVLPQHKTVEALRQYVADHNAIFPETEIKIEGMSETPDGSAPITSQSEVKGVPAKPAEIAAMMADKGFEKRGRLFVNDEAGIRVGDLTPENVIKTDDGQLRVIDAAIKRFDANGGEGGMTAPEPVKKSTQPAADNRYDLIKGLSESKLVALSKQLGVDPKGMSGERLRSRVASNAREADIIEAIANPAPEVAAPKKSRIKGSSADKWADKKIKDSLGRVNAGIDPELLAAYAVKLAGQLETGAVKFGEWSKRMVDEAGEQIRPMLSRIWEEAHSKAGKTGELPPEPRTISGAEENRAQSEAVTGHEYLKDTNKAQEESGQRYVDYVKKTQDWEGAVDAVEGIPHLADRSVAVAQLLEEANRTLNTPDTLPEFDRLMNRLAPQVLGEKTELGQGLQSQQVVNRIIEPLRPYLGWRRMIQARLSELAGKFPKESAELINKGMKDAGNEAAGVIKGAVDGKGTVPTLESANKITSNIKTPKPVIDQNLGEAIMQRVRQSAGYREFFTKKGTKQIADRFWQLLSGAKKPEGNVWTFDGIVTSELGRILDEQLKKSGAVSEKTDGISTAEKIAQFLSDDPLRADKVKAIDEAVRGEIAKRPPEDAELLSELWDASVGAMIDSPASDTMARRIIQESLKDSKTKWGEVFRSGNDAVKQLKDRIIKSVSDKVGGVPNGGRNLDLASFRDQVGKVFDEIASVRKDAYEKNKAIQEARAKSAASPQAEAATLLNQFAKLQSDTQAWTDKTAKPVKAALSDFLSGKSDGETFLKALDALGVKRATSETLLSVAERQKEVRDTWKQITDTENILASLEKNSALVAPIRKIAASLGIDWNQLFTDLPEAQAARKAEVLSRLNSDPKFSNLTEASKTKLVDALNNAWEQLRADVFRREFDKVIKLPNIGREQREVLEKSLPKIVERANLGLMDNEAFLNAIGERYGIEGIDGPTGKKLRDLGQKAARAPEGIERNEIYQQIMDTIMEARGVNASDFLKDYWYRNVMSAPRTAVEIGAGGIVQGMARTFTTAVDTAVGLKRPDIALRMIGMFLKDAGTGARLGYDLVKTGDRAILPRYKEQFLSKMERLEQGKSPGGEIESLYRRSGPAGKVALAPFELTGRVLTGLDYIGGQGVRSQQMLYSALAKGDKASFEAAMRRFDANEVKAAEQQARTEIGPDARPAQVIARSREILNEGISKDIQAFGNNMTEVTALNAPPVGLGGEIYKAASQIPMMIRAPSGLAFAKAAINLVQESSNWAPITGQINVARSLWRNPSKNNPFRFLALDKLPPERARQLVVAQGTGLAIMLAAANKFLSDQPEDKDGKPRSMEITGGWDGLTPTQKGALMSAGEKPFAIKLPSGRWVDYKLTPFVASLATIGHWRDQQRFNGKKWNDEEVSNKVGNAWLSGLGAVRDLSVSSQFSSLAGHLLASDSREMDTKGFMRALTDTVGNAAMGLVPMSSLLRELDQTDDPQRYRAGKKNPGLDLWLTQVPFVRRTVGDGPLLDFLGRPVKVEVNPFNRHIGPAPSEEPVTSALSEKVSMGMKLPTLADNTSITELKNGKLEKRPMTDEESYNYQKAVRQGFARQLANDLPAFAKATPEQAAIYSQLVFTDAERYARDRLNTGAKFDGIIPVNPKLSSALSPDYQRVKEMDASDSSQSAVDRSNIRVKYQEMMALPPAQRMSAIRDVAINNPELARKFLQHVVSPSTERNALEKATGGLDASTRAEFFVQELSKRKTPAEKQAFISQQLKTGLITKEVLRQMAVQGQRN